jgi:hypothetical protein
MEGDGFPQSVRKCPAGIIIVMGVIIFLLAWRKLKLKIL